MRLFPLQLSLPLTVAMSLSGLWVAFVASPAAHAQIFTGLESHPSVAMPDIAPKSDIQATQDIKTESPAETLRFLPNTPEGFKLTGETGELSWPVYLTDAQARSTTRFRMGYVSAISVLPDASLINVKINNTTIGSDSIDAASGLRAIEFNVPAGILQPGFNAVSVSAKQRHRVDCSVAATYELWTKIDPAQTGLVLGNATRGITAVSELPALLPKSDGTLPIHILLSGKTNPPHLQRLMRLTQEIALAGHFLQPAIDFGPAENDVYGLDLVLGTRAALGRLSQLAGFLETSGPLLKIVPVPPSMRPMLIVTGSNDSEVDQAIALLGQASTKRGTPAGLKAIARYPAFSTPGATSLTLSDLGLQNQDFDGRVFHESVNLELPADFLASDYGRGTFDLAGGYAAGLAPGGQVRVDVNGRSAGVIKLADSGGDTFRHERIFVPLSLMTAGLNHIDIVSETPRTEDAVCGASGAGRFFLLGSSQLTLPRLAHVERIPDLTGMTAGGLPYLKGVAHLIVPQPDRDTMAAALSLSVRAAVTAGQLIPFQFSTKTEPADDGSTLIVSAARQLDPALMEAVGLDPAAVEAAWHDIALQKADSRPRPADGRWWSKYPEGPSACHLPMPLPIGEPSAAPSRLSPDGGGGPSSNSDDILENWARQDVLVPSLWKRIAKVAGLAGLKIQNLAYSFKAAPMTPPQAEGLTADASLILAQGVSSDSQDHVTTIVTAPNAFTLRASMACLFDPQIWPKVRGRLVTLSSSNGDVVATPAASLHYVASGEPSIINARLVLAGWFSLNPLAFAAMALLMALCLSGATLWFVRNVGRKPE